MDSKIKILLHAARADDAVINRMAISGLGELKNPSVVESLLELLDGML